MLDVATEAVFEDGGGDNRDIFNKEHFNNKLLKQLRWSSIRVKKILEHLSRTQFFTGFVSRALLSAAS